MSMNMMELHNVLGDRVNITLKEDMTPEERQIENEQSALVMNIGKQMIQNADLILRYEKLQAQTKGLHKSRMEKIIGE